MDSKTLVKASVILSNYNNAVALNNSIQSLLAQDYGNYELIVVDAGSTDQSRQTLTLLCEQGSIVAYLHPILDAPLDINTARETGIKLSAGEILCFADSDCVYPHNWLSTIVESFSQNEVAAVFGPRNPDEGAGLGAYVRRLEGFRSRKFQCKETKTFTATSSNVFYFAGCNLAVTRTTLSRLCISDPSFREVTFEDVDLQRRMLDAGYSILFEPRMCIRHIHPLSTIGLLRKASRSGAGFARLVQKHPQMKSAKWSPVADILAAMVFAAMIPLSQSLPAEWRVLLFLTAIFVEGLRRLYSRSLLKQNYAILILAVPIKLFYDAIRFYSFAQVTASLVNAHFGARLWATMLPLDRNNASDVRAHVDDGQWR